MNRNLAFSSQHIRQSFSRHAEAYDYHAELQRSVLFNALTQLQPHFRPGMVLLDAGCGTGYLLELLKSREIPLSILACDSALGMCRRAAARQGDRLENLVTCADIRMLPYVASSCDLAVSSLTMQWLEEGESALSEIYRVLKPGGWAIITTFGPATLQELRDAFAGVDDAPHVSTFPPATDMQSWVESCGFMLENLSTEFRTLHYPGVKELMHAIRAIGANNKLENRRKTLTGRSRFAAMEVVYHEAHQTERGIPASWEILYFLLRKPL